jgi:hypothetical protein
VDKRTEWAPRTAGIAAIAVGAMVMAMFAVTLDTDAPGRILGTIAALGLSLFAVGSWRARPRLAITPDGLVYRGWVRKRVLSRADIELIRITEFRRWARKVRLLEIDTKDDQLLVLNRWDLGGDPLDVLDALTDAGYAGRR